MHALNNFMLTIDSYLGSAQWFVFLLLGTGVFFTLYLGFPQIRYFAHALRIVRGKYDKASDTGDTSHFQALTTALSGTVGTGNIAGVAVAIWLGGPAALFWMLVTAFLGMTTKFVEVSLSHKYRDILPDGTVSGGPMYFMKKRLNYTNASGKTYKTGHILGSIFAVATIFSAFGTGSLPQMKSIADALESTFGLAPIITGLTLAILLGLVIIGGISRIAKVTERLVPAMAFIYLAGALSVIIYNYSNIIPSFLSIFSHILSGSAATGGFLGASLAFAFNRGVNRGLFSNEAGQGSAPIAHAAARADEPISEGMVAILEPFIDTIIICTITGLVLLSSGVWTEKHQNIFQSADLEILAGDYTIENPLDKVTLYNHLADTQPIAPFSGTIEVHEGRITNNGFTLMHARSLAEGVIVYTPQHEFFTGNLTATNGKIDFQSQPVSLEGRSLIHSTSLTIEAFKRGFLGDWGKYIVSIGLLLFAFSTAISWSYYGDRAVTYLWGSGFVLYYRIIYVIGFFLAALIDTTVVWTFSGITIALMTIPNLVGILILHKDIKATITEYWINFKTNN